MCVYESEIIQINKNKNENDKEIINYKLYIIN